MESKIPTKESSWTIGSIVAFESYLYSKSSDFETVYISGDQQLISPLMIIVETSIEKNSYEESSGLAISSKGSYQCKCMWYSHKNHQFEDAWISSRLLKMIEEYKPDELELEPESDAYKKKKMNYGNSVVFKTSKLELKKKKLTYKQNNYFVNENTVTAYLAFVSPLMHVVGTCKSESKEPLINIKTGEKIREISKLLIKCKYYNPYSDKLSEALIPVEALEKIAPVNSDTLKRVQDIIDNAEFVVLVYKRREYLIKPSRIKCVNGEYSLMGLDYIHDALIDFPINDITIKSHKPTYIAVEYPSFEFKPKKLKIEDISESVINKLSKQTKGKHYTRIEYSDRNEKLTNRFIEDYSIIDLELDGKTPVLYVKAYCLLRKAVRYFRLGGIRKIQVFDLS